MRAPLLATLLGGTLVSLAACGGGHLEPVPPAYRTGFTGTWILNRDLSTTLGAQGGEAARGEPNEGGRGGMGGGYGGRGGGGFGGRGGGYGGRGGGYGGRGGGEEGGREGGRGGRGGGFDRVAMREAMRLLAPSPQMDILLRDSTVTIETGRQADEKVTLPLDDKAVESALPEDHKLKTKAKFDPKDDILVVERSISGGQTIQEKYTLTPEADRVIVDVTLKGGPGGNRNLRRVYDRQKSE